MLIDKDLKHIVSSVTGNSDGGKVLFDSIWKLHTKTRRKDYTTEELTVMNWNGARYNNTGNNGSVAWTVSMLYDGMTDGLMFSGHNHPQSSCFQSFKDFERTLELNVDHAYTLGTDGCLIVSNTREPVLVNPDKFKGDFVSKTRSMLKSHRDSNRNHVPLSCVQRVENRSRSDFKRLYKDELSRITGDTGLSGEDKISRVELLYGEYLSSNTVKYINMLNKEFRDNGVDYLELTFIEK